MEKKYTLNQLQYIYFTSSAFSLSSNDIDWLNRLINIMYDKITAFSGDGTTYASMKVEDEDILDLAKDVVKDKKIVLRFIERLTKKGVLNNMKVLNDIYRRPVTLIIEWKE